MQRSSVTRWSFAILASIAGHTLLLGNAGAPPSGAAPSAAMVVALRMAAPVQRETSDKSAVTEASADRPAAPANPTPPKAAPQKPPPKPEPQVRRTPPKPAPPKAKPKPVSPKPKKQLKTPEKPPKQVVRKAEPKPKTLPVRKTQPPKAKPKKVAVRKPAARKPKIKPKRAARQAKARPTQRLKHAAKRRTAPVKGRTRKLRKQSNQLALRKSPDQGAGGAIPLMRRIRLVGSPRPAHYPAMSVEREEQGTVIVRALINPSGQPTRVSVWRSSGYPRLDQSAVAAVRGWRFVPASRNGAGILAWVQVPIRFRLE